MEKVYLQGPVVCGLYGAFEADYGNPESASMPRVTPSRAGDALLPFRCPDCDDKVDFSDPKRREQYHDARVVEGRKRDNYWCPSCGARFRLNGRGCELDGKPDDEGVAPAIVERVKMGGDGLVDYSRTISGRQSIFGRFRDYLRGIDAGL